MSQYWLLQSLMVLLQLRKFFTVLGSDRHHHTDGQIQNPNYKCNLTGAAKLQIFACASMMSCKVKYLDLILAQKCANCNLGWWISTHFTAFHVCLQNKFKTEFTVVICLSEINLNKSLNFSSQIWLSLTKHEMLSSSWENSQACIFHILDSLYCLTT